MTVKRVVSFFAALSCMLMLSFCLTGCGPDYRPNFVGDWRVVSMQNSDGTDLTPTIEQLASIGKYVTLSLAEEDDEATLDLADKATLTGNWKPTGEDACVITFEGDDEKSYGEVAATLTDEGTLVFEEDNRVMTLEKLTY